MSSFITLMILSLLVINSSYAQNYGSSNSTSNNNDYNLDNLEITTNDTTTKTLSSSSLSYKFEPFLSLDGTTFKDIPNNDTLTLNNFAIAAWINTNQSTLSESSLLVNKGGFNSEEEGDNMNYGIWFSKNGNIQGGFETESGENLQVSSSAKYNDGKWYFILLSYDGSILRLDIDGKQISTKNTNGAIPDSTGKEPLRIGANSLENDKYFTGYIDEVRVWNRGLTDKEISQIYANNTFNSKGQVVYLDFKNNDSSSSNAISNSNNSSNIISNNTSSIASLYTNKTSEIENNNNNFNIAVAADWGCDDSAKKTVENIQEKDPELVIAAGDLSYEESSKCWFEIIKPLKSKMKIAMGDHEYSNTKRGAVGIVNQYLKPLNLEKTYYSFDINNVHVTIIDPYINYKLGSTQYQFIENDLKTASNNPEIDWTFVVESTPMYTSSSVHPADSTIRYIYHPIFDKYEVDLVFSSDNHNYQRTYPLKYNSSIDSSDNPIIVDRNQHNYNYNNKNNDNKGIIYFITGTAGRSHYEIKEQAPFVAKQDDKHFGFLNIDIDGKTLKGTFYANESELPNYYYVDYQNNIIDEFTISKIDTQ
ncbi:MAG TPA: LamG-like jellyroll fold domain-containing protein [Nitrososphaeraceae archaeon]|nr:LamG-like jellyroll fold domain-containing protein [Nitrososphaeraceae archaeon]